MKKAVKLLKLAIFLLCAGYIIKYFYSNWDSLQITFKISKVTITAIIFIFVITLLTTSYRYKIIMLKCSGINPPFWKWFRVIMLARFYNLFFAPSGNIYRGIELKRKFNISYTDYVSASVSFTWMDLILDLIFSLAVILIARPGLKLGNFKAYQIIVCIITALICLPIIANFILKGIPVKSSSLIWIKQKLAEVISATINNVRDIAYLSKVMVWGIMFTIEAIIAYRLLFQSFQIKIDIPSIFLFYSLLKISTAFIITPGNIGVQEIAFGFLSSQIGAGMATGIFISTICRVLGTSITIVIALIMAPTELFTKRNIITDIENGSN